jgi:hypothetical protein
MGYFKTSLGLETPETENSPSLTGDLKNLAGQINALLLTNKVANGQVYAPFETRTVGTEYEPNATRATQVTVEVQVTFGTPEWVVLSLSVGGEEGPSTSGGPVEIASIRLCIASLTFIVPAGLKWKATVEKQGGTTVALKSQYLQL